MPTRSIPFLASHYYHIYNHGVNRNRIFLSDDNYTYLLHLLKKNYSRYAIDIVAYCLLPNHYHFLIKPNEDNNLSLFMKSLFGSYTQALNKQQGREGPLFQGRFRPILVDKEEYLARLARYIHLNPVMAGLAQSPQERPYSNYLDVIGNRGGTLKDTSLVPDRFETGHDYQVFVEDLLHSQGEIKYLQDYLLD